MIFQCEPHPEMTGLIRAGAGFAGETVIRVNPQRLGCEANTGRALAQVAGRARSS